jgi:sugar phosphate isomerase/epimerase
MKRRLFIGSATAGIILSSTTASHGGESELPFSALGACAPMSRAKGIKAAGGEYIEENCKRLLVPDKPEAEWLKNLEKSKTCPLPFYSCNSFLPGSLRSTCADADHDAVLAYAEIAFERAQQLGIKIIVFGSSGSRNLKDGFPVEKATEQFVALLKKMGPLAEPYGVTVAIEPLRRQECNFINTVLEGGAIVERVNHPNVRMVFDIYHMLQNGEDPNDLKKLGPYLAHGHIAEKEKRTAPGVMGDDFRPFFAALKEINYKGRISIEGKWKVEELPKAYAVIRKQASEA